MKKILPNVTLAALVLISANLRSDVDNLMSFDAHNAHVVESSGSLDCPFHVKIDPSEMRSQYLPEVSPEWSIDPRKRSDFVANDDVRSELVAQKYEHPEWSIDPRKRSGFIVEDDVRSELAVQEHRNPEWSIDPDKRPDLIAKSDVRPELSGEKKRSELLVENEVRPEFLVKNDVRPELIVEPDVRPELKVEDSSQDLSF